MKIVHLSDLHFGTEKDEVEEYLLSALSLLEPDLVIISGDFTQTARYEEFQEARAFLDALNVPYLCVPGNHDIPAYNLFERFFAPYRRYKKYISDELCPVFQNNEVLITGLNSARRALLHWNWANGAVSKRQCRRLQSIFKSNAPAQWNICFLHHPVFFDTANSPLKVTVFGRDTFLKSLAESDVDIVLTGHTHHAGVAMQQSGITAGNKIIHIGASTALSTRLRKQANGFNLLHLRADQVEIFTYSLEEGGFKEVDRITIAK